MDEAVTIYFGEPWDAPVVDDATRYPEIPTYAKCIRCGEYFADGDQGLIMPMIGGAATDLLIGIGDGYALVGEHRECNMSAVVGHLVGVCSCTGYDICARDTSREVMRRVDAGALDRLAR